MRRKKKKKKKIMNTKELNFSIINLKERQIGSLEALSVTICKLNAD